MKTTIEKAFATLHAFLTDKEHGPTTDRAQDAFDEIMRYEQELLIDTNKALDSSIKVAKEWRDLYLGAKRKYLIALTGFGITSGIVVGRFIREMFF